VIDALACQRATGDTAQVLIYERDELLECGVVATSPAIEQLGNLLGPRR